MNLQLALPQSNHSNSVYSFDNPRPQNFVIPYTIIKYIYSSSSSVKAWKKMIRACKYFFSKHRVYPIECLETSMRSTTK
uniref:Ovule protein n=1 Tax=Panagrolaimus superbus TaxID=310955 RepID=A0A914Y8L1_9BILA